MKYGKNKIIYFNDEQEDFFVPHKNKFVVGEKYKYIKDNALWKILSWFVYRCIMTPFSWLYMKIKYSHKIINKKLLKKEKRGLFVYSNHVLLDGDAFLPTLASFPKKAHIVVDPNNLSKRFFRCFLEMNGAMPLPDCLSSSKKFVEAVSFFIKKREVIQIYPEAHVWPYYTGIRDFGSSCFKYPVMLKTPVYVMTNVFVKRRFVCRPKVISFIDGPFEIDEKLHSKIQADQLKEKVYNVMCERAKNGNYIYIKYVKREEND